MGQGDGKRNIKIKFRGKRFVLGSRVAQKTRSRLIETGDCCLDNPSVLQSSVAIGSTIDGVTRP